MIWQQTTHAHPTTLRPQKVYCNCSDPWSPMQGRTTFWHGLVQSNMLGNQNTGRQVWQSSHQGSGKSAESPHYCSKMCSWITIQWYHLTIWWYTRSASTHKKSHQPNTWRTAKTQSFVPYYLNTSGNLQERTWLPSPTQCAMSTRSSKWGSPTFVMPPKDNTVRWVSDLHELNKVILLKQYLLPI